MYNIIQKNNFMKYDKKKHKVFSKIETGRKAHL